MSEETGETRQDDEDLGFGEALEELERILRRIEGDEVDIDALARELHSASELLELCRSKLRRAEEEVKLVVERLEGDG